MFITHIITAEDGSISAAESTPDDAICTITTPDGCEVYMPGDEHLLAERIGSQGGDVVDAQCAGIRLPRDIDRGV